MPVDPAIPMIHPRVAHSKGTIANTTDAKAIVIEILRIKPPRDPPADPSRKDIK